MHADHRPADTLTPRLTAILPLFKAQQASQAALSACLDAFATGRTTQEKWQTFARFSNDCDRPRAKLDSD
jgi:hypothetical protein